MGAERRILVVVDPTADAQPAVSRAAWLARSLNCGVELFICHYDPYLSGERFFDSPDLKAARHEVMDLMLDRVAALAEPLLVDGLDVITDAAWDTPLHEGIVRKAQRSDARMVLKDTHHHHALKRSVFSNTDWNLIRTCPTPLWLVKPGPVAASPVLLAAVDPLHDQDGPAELDRVILRQARVLAEATGATLHLLHAYDPMPVIAGTASYPMAVPISLPVERIAEDMLAEHGAAVHELAQAFGLADDRVHLLRGPIRDLLAEQAGELRADLVIMGAVARGALQRIFIGSTAEQVLDRLPCDVLVVKPEDFVTPVRQDLAASAAR